MYGMGYYTAWSWGFLSYHDPPEVREKAQVVSAFLQASFVGLNFSKSPRWCPGKTIYGAEILPMECRGEIFTPGWNTQIYFRPLATRCNEPNVPRHRFFFLWSMVAIFSVINKVVAISFQKGLTLPEINMAPKNGWLEDEPFLLGWPIFRGHVSFTEGNVLLSEKQIEKWNNISFE